jgi:hypothetical protein
VNGPEEITITEASTHVRGEVDAAFEWLTRSYDQRDAGTALMKSELFLRSLHGDPRWETLLRKIGLAD